MIGQARLSSVFAWKGSQEVLARKSLPSRGHRAGFARVSNLENSSREQLLKALRLMIVECQ